MTKTSALLILALAMTASNAGAVPPAARPSRPPSQPPLIEAVNRSERSQAYLMVRVARDGTIVHFRKEGPGSPELQIVIGQLDASRVAELQAAVDRLEVVEPVPVDPGARPCLGGPSKVYRVTRSDGRAVKVEVVRECIEALHPSGALLSGVIQTLDSFQQFLVQLPRE
jgi:hypothetical protein